MPLYEYHCEKCGEKIEMRRCIAERDDPLTCPACASTAVSRALPRVAALGRDGGAEASSYSLGGSGGCSGCAGGSCSTCGSRN